MTDQDTKRALTDFWGASPHPGDVTAPFRYTPEPGVKSFLKPEFDQTPILDCVRKLIEQAQEIPNLTAAERQHLKNCWTAHASIEVPRAMRQLRDIDPPAQHEALVMAFFDDMQSLAARVQEVVDAHDKDTSHQLHTAITECAHTKTVLEHSKSDLEMRLQIDALTEMGRFR